MVDCKTCKADCVYKGEAQKKKCLGYIPMTNGDKIRSMTDEELAKWLDYEFGRCEWCDVEKIEAEDCSDIDCTICIQGWLKQPHEEEEK